MTRCWYPSRAGNRKIPSVTIGRSELWPLARSSFKGWLDDGAASMGAALAFYTLFSLAPLLLVAIALAGFFVGRETAEQAMIGLVAQFTEEKSAAVVQTLVSAASARGGNVLSVLATTALLVLGATTLFAELQADLNRIWRYKAPKTGGIAKFLRARLSAFALVVAVGALLLTSVGASAFLQIAGRELFGGSRLLAQLGEAAISFLLLTGLFAMIYKLLPTPHIAWSDVWVGAAITSVLFWVGKILISLYIARAAVGANLGAGGAIVVLVAWVYYSAQVFFLGAEFTRQYAVTHGSHQTAPEPLLEAA